MSYMRTLAIDPTSKGFCFALLESSEKLLDFGCVEVAPHAGEVKDKIAKILEEDMVDLVVVEDPMTSHRGRRALRRIQATLDAAADRDLLLYMVSREEVKAQFQLSGTTKHEIAVAVGRQFPELSPRLPAKRSAWQAEAEAMNIFDAVSFALTALFHVERKGY